MTANLSKLGDKSNLRIPSSEARRANKPLMEKRRRARINQSLSILKTLIVDTNREKKPSKLEKADILEFTVSYLQKNQNLCPDLREQKFTQGYQECTKAALKFLESCNIDQPTLEKLVEFLRSRRESSNKICTTKSKWNSFSENRKDNPVNPMDKDKCISRIVPGAESFRLTLEGQPLFSSAKLDLKYKDQDIQNKSSEVFSTDLQRHSGLNQKSTKSSTTEDTIPSNLKAVQLSPVNLSLDVYSNIQSFDSCYYLNNTNLSNPSSISSSLANFEDIHQPLNLCCKYSTMDEEQGVWRPW